MRLWQFYLLLGSYLLFTRTPAVTFSHFSASFFRCTPPLQQLADPALFVIPLRGAGFYHALLHYPLPVHLWGLCILAGRFLWAFYPPVLSHRPLSPVLCAGCFVRQLPATKAGPLAFFAVSSRTAGPD